ncbi:DUF7504 family protein [Natrarchaeobius oligotrophus]
MLVLAPSESDGADAARGHFHTGTDVAIIVTTNVVSRLRVLETKLESWPSRTIVLTTKDEPLANLDGLDVSSVSLEIVQLDRGLGLAGLGETISRVIAEHEGPETKISVEVDVLSDLIDKFELERVFRFLHLLTSRIENANALSHFYCNPETKSGPTINLISELFDLRINASNERFVLET